MSNHTKNKVAPGINDNDTFASLLVLKIKIGKNDMFTVIDSEALVPARNGNFFHKTIIGFVGKIEFKMKNINQMEL